MKNNGVNIEVKNGFLECSYGRGTAKNLTRKLLGIQTNRVIWGMSSKNIIIDDGKIYYKNC